MRSLLIFAAAPMIAAGVQSAQTPAEQPAEQVAARRVSVSGVVRDATTQMPISGMTVRISENRRLVAQVISDESGIYRAIALVSDSATVLEIEASRIGYGIQRAAMTVSADSNAVVRDLLVSPYATTLDAVTSSATSDPSTGVRLPMAVTRLDASGMPVPNLSGGALSIQGKVAGVTITAAGAVPAGGTAVTSLRGDPRGNTEEYAKIDDNPFIAVSDAPLSTFSADVDRAAYANVRRFIRTRAMPPRDAVRVEELINYFHYSYPTPRGEHPIAISTEVTEAPWNRNHQILRVALNTSAIEVSELPSSNLVFLIDVSGSMSPPNRLPLAKQAFRFLVEQLREQDLVSIVVYAGHAGIVLPPTSGADKVRIMEAIDGLGSGGSTAGAAGIQLAYDVASRNFIAGGNNRVILATDGDFNVGISSSAELTRFVEERRAEGIALTALGFGMGNYKDARLEQLANRGNGNYAYIDDIAEARKVFVQEMGATLVTVAKDVKLQVELNPATVQAYRLIGYENRMLRAQDFTDDRKDAGDLGAGHSVTALYEIIPAGAPLDVTVGDVPPLRYQPASPRVPATRAQELATVSVRYKTPHGETSRLLEHPVLARSAAASADTRFAMAVAAYGMLLRGSPHRGTFTYEDVLSMARGALGADRGKYRGEFVEMVRATREIAEGEGRR